MIRSLLAVLAFVCTAPLLAQHDHERFHTDRAAPRLLPLPKEDDVFHFVIFGDRTGGPRSGVRVLEQAVADTNLLDPDLVMTVGDLIQGYNETGPWLEEMREFRAVMQRLRMPWMPVAGNHDIYYRGAGKTPAEHEGNYEQHFGPLWYAFDHKQCTFLVLYSDEANPTDGTRDFEKHENHTMSRAQLGWLRGALQRAARSRHVMVFLHHPRWIEDRYGKAWDEVHRVLADAGNVRAVFAGHIHRMRYDGVRDGIEYFALATTGGSLSADVPQAGYLHHFNVVTVRPDGLRVATVPVGAVLDPKQITGAVSDDVTKLNEKLELRQDHDLTIAAAGAVDGECSFALTNPCARPIEVTLTLAATDRRWIFEPDHRHATVPPGQKCTLHFRVARADAEWDANFALPLVRLGCDYLGDGLRLSLPEREVPFGATPTFAADAAPASAEHALELDGRAGCARIDSAHLPLADGPFTIEAWLRGRKFDGRRGLLSQAQSSAFGLFVSDGKPVFSVHAGGAYANAKAKTAVLRPSHWHHLAGVYDEREVRLYVDGQLVGRAPAPGKRKHNDLPLYVGADTDGDGQPESFFDGQIDEVRISNTARYGDAAFTPSRNLTVDAQTLLLLHCDRSRGPWLLDAGAGARHPRLQGGASVGRVQKVVVR